MTWFVILPLWLASLGAMALATVATRVVARLAPAFPYAWRVLVWSSVGFVAANALVLAGFVVVARAVDGAPPASGAAKVGLGAALLLAPVIASAAGFLGGAGPGVVLAWRVSRAGARRP